MKKLAPLFMAGLLANPVGSALAAIVSAVPPAPFSYDYHFTDPIEFVSFLEHNIRLDGPEWAYRHFPATKTFFTLLQQDKERAQNYLAKRPLPEILAINYLSFYFTASIEEGQIDKTTRPFVDIASKINVEEMAYDVVNHSYGWCLVDHNAGRLAPC